MAAATARTAVQAAADAAAGAAQITAPADRADEGAPAARIASAAARSPIIKTRTPATAEPEQGQAQILAFGGTTSPVFKEVGVERGGGAQRLRPAAPSTTSPPRLSPAPRPGNAEAPAAASLSLLAWGCRRPQRLTPPRRRGLGHRRRGGNDVPGADAGDRPHPDAL